MRAVLIVSLAILCLLPTPLVCADRGIKVKELEDLTHDHRGVGTYRALIIGINDYRDNQIPDLETAKNDALAMADLLQKRYGFKIDSRKDILLNHKATRASIYKALRNMASSAGPSDNVLIYYAGHGDLDQLYDDGWWIPVDAKAGDPTTYLDNLQVQKAIRSMKARHVLLISDSCYSGTLFGKRRALPRVINDKYYLGLFNEKSRWGMTSGNKTPVADSGTGGHSIFAYQLLKALRKNQKPYISTQELYTRIAPIISNNSEIEQIPMCSPILRTGDQGGQFIFIDISDTVVDSQVTPTKSVKGHLYVRTKPQNATIRILNIRSKFIQGIELNPGKYHLEVVANGYVTRKAWISLATGEDKSLDIYLKPLEEQRQDRVAVLNILDLKEKFKISKEMTMLLLVGGAIVILFIFIAIYRYIISNILPKERSSTTSREKADNSGVAVIDNNRMAGFKLVKGTGMLGFLGGTREYDKRLNEIATLIASKVKQGRVEIPEGNFDHQSIAQICIGSLVRAMQERGFVVVSKGGEVIMEINSILYNERIYDERGFGPVNDSTVMKVEGYGYRMKVRVSSTGERVWEGKIIVPENEL